MHLGKRYNLAEGKPLSEILRYDSDNLTTHAVIVGMTGSGKTGLAMTLLEEIALQKIPAIMIDPKGDLTNSLLHFPDLAPSDFKLWTRDAEKTSEQWREGLVESGITKEKIEQLSNSVEFALYTPGSAVATPVSVFSSLKAPDEPWDTDYEILRERISGISVALLGLMGEKSIDTINDERHILITSIIEFCWRNKEDVTIEGLINMIMKPPIERLGVFSVDEFLPPSERNKLATKINHFLASPSFNLWISGQELDIERILYTRDGDPRHSVFYIAHLSEEERMFFVTLLYSSIESWMRKQGGSDGLRALVFFDEVTGYLPPIANPPSKGVILRMLKHARAYGVGMILASQNPVDLDYKALSNAGTWFIGKLQTEQDKRRLLSGLGNANQLIDTKIMDTIISSLKNRVFLMHSIYESTPIVYQARWCMNFLAGPLEQAAVRELHLMLAPEVDEVKMSFTLKKNTVVSARAIPVFYQSADLILEDDKKPYMRIYRAVSAEGYAIPERDPYAHDFVKLPAAFHAPISAEVMREVKSHGVLWLPFYKFVDEDGNEFEVPAYKKREEHDV